MSREATHIVVTLDGPELAPEVTRVVQRLASPTGAEVTLLHVIVPSGENNARVGDLAPVVDLAERRTRAELKRAGRALDGIAVRQEVIVGRDRAREILSWLRAHRVDWVVMAARRRGLRGILRRGVAERVRSASPAPVLTIHSARSSRPEPLTTQPATLHGRPLGAA